MTRKADERAGVPAFRRVALVAKTGPEQGLRIAAELGRWLSRRGIRVRYDAVTSKSLGRRDGFRRDTLPVGTDLAIVAGGDGTLLGVARAAAPLGIPILGVNFGGLGFMSELQPEELYSGLERVLDGEYRIEERHALRVRFRRRRRPVGEWTLLNDAVITKSALARMINLRMKIDGEGIATYTSDGLIIATPTGSTAYNLAAGGPVLDPRMSAFVIAPICPHTLMYRPLVVPGTVTVDVTLESGGEEAYLTLDGQVGFPLEDRDAIAVDTSPHAVRLVRVAGRSFFEVLRRKLHWGER